MQAALQAMPADNPDFSPSLLRLQKRIKKKEDEVTTLGEKALAVGALSAEDAQGARSKLEKANGQLCGNGCVDDQVSFAGVQAPSSVVASGGCSSTVNEELANLALDDD